MRRTGIQTFACLLLVTSAGSPSRAFSQAREQKQVLRAGVHYSRTLGGSTFIEPGDLGSVIATGNDYGYDLSYEMKSKIVGFKVGMARDVYKIDTEGHLGDFHRLRMTPVTLNLLFHPNPRGTVDVYLGGGAAYVRFSDIEGARVGSIEISNQVTWNVEVGLDIRFGDGRHGLDLHAAYMDARAQSRFEREVEVIPFNLGAAFAYHW